MTKTTKPAPDIPLSPPPELLDDQLVDALERVADAYTAAEAAEVAFRQSLPAPDEAISNVQNSPTARSRLQTAEPLAVAHLVTAEEVRQAENALEAVTSARARGPWPEQLRRAHSSEARRDLERLHELADELEAILAGIGRRAATRAAVETAAAGILIRQWPTGRVDHRRHGYGADWRGVQRFIDVAGAQLGLEAGNPQSSDLTPDTSASGRRHSGAVDAA